METTPQAKKMTIEKAKAIYAAGPRFDVGVDAEFYVAKGFIEGWMARAKDEKDEAPF